MLLHFVRPLIAFVCVGLLLAAGTARPAAAQDQVAPEPAAAAEEAAVEEEVADEEAAPEQADAEAPAPEDAPAEEEAPATDESSAEEPSAEEPAAEEPASDEPAADEPASEQPASEDAPEPQDAPASEQPATEEPATEQPATEEPAAAEPADEPATPPQADSPTEPTEPPTPQPSSEEPKTEEPKSEEPKSEEPKTEDPSDEEPKAEEPAPKPAPRKRDLVATTLDEVDDDFVYQGEYASAARYGYGLQVVALGDGRFDAVLYPGGLPGAGWTGGEKHPFQGDLENGVIYLQGDRYALKVRGGYAELLIGGRHAGFLDKTHRTSPTMHAPAPRGAKILFDGTSVEAFDKGKLTPEGYLASGTSTRDKFRDFRLHAEFRLPYKPYARGQGRGNSGLYLQRRYEVQVLDSFGLEGEANECGGLYRQKAPDVNMCLPPLSWQTYDIYFRAARFDDEGNKTEDARITVYHNGYPIHYRYELTGKTGAGRAEADTPGEIYLQDHGNPVAFRNFWIVEGEQAADVAGSGTVACPCCQRCCGTRRAVRLFCR